MWPQALQMTRDECRGILRRLELESYSQVISVFRAQGGLSDAKAKLLEELRGIFHISNERHRAEARRVANDEQLATIADAISGPNTWQEWSREGRRPYPMLPRVAPQTALALMANNVAEETARENSKLPYPAETADIIKEEQLETENQKSKEITAERSNYVVTNDPFKIPEIPQHPKKNLKRNNEHQNCTTGKKRSAGDTSALQGHAQAVRKNYPHITANSPQTISITSSLNANSERKQKINASDQYLEKQRFFHRQHQLSKQKMVKKAAAVAALSANNAAMSGNASIKKHAIPSKSGRRANQKLQQEHQKHLAMKQLKMDIQQQQQIPVQIDFGTAGGVVAPPVGTSASAAQAMLTQQQIDMQFVTYATHHQPPQQIFMEKDIEGTNSQLTALSTGATSTGAILAPASSSNQYPQSLITSLSSPQIAASKRDISKNLNKLQMQQNQQISSNISSVSAVLPSSAPMASHDLQTSLGNILSSSATSASSPSDKSKSIEKTLISTTPVQKYIVEERQPGISINLPTCSTPNTIVNIQNTHGSTSSQTHIIQVSNAGQQPQIMTFPQISAAATKLRAVNTTLIAPVNKITPGHSKKMTSGSITSSSTGLVSSTGSTINAGALHELANVASTQSQVLHVVETGGNNNPAGGTPLQTPPAVIQIHNSTSAPNAISSDNSSVSAHNKVVSTKILPLVLAGASNSSSTNNNLLNTSTLVMASSTVSSLSITSTTSTAGGPTIIKTVPSNVVLNTSTANLTPATFTSTNNPSISNLVAGGTVFRKPPNIVKTSVAATTLTKSTSSSAPHIISNVKLTPVSVGPSTSGAHLTTANTFKNVLPSTAGMVRTSVKICQSSNGKVFIQSAGLVDGSKMKLNTSTIPHKIISSAPTANTSAITSGGQRIAIQKVQIIPAPISSPAGGNVPQNAGNHMNTKTGKSNMIFMPSSTANVRPVTLSKMGNNILLKSSANQQITNNSPTSPMSGVTSDNSMAKSNIVVFSPSPTTLMKEQVSQNSTIEDNQLINEDTPLDILNMPIVMEPGVGVTSPPSTAETVTVLQSNVIDGSNVSTPSTLGTPIILEQAQLQQAPKTVVLNVDWEMKLDIEQQNQYNIKNVKQNKKTLGTTSSSITSSANNQHSHLCTSGLGSKNKHLKNEYISMDLKARDSSNPINVTGTTLSSTRTTPANNVIILDDSFDDVIVEEHEDDVTPLTSFEKHQQLQQAENDNDIPKILDMQIYQQHDLHDNRVAQIKTNNDDDVEMEDFNDDSDGDNAKLQSKQMLKCPESAENEIDLLREDLQRKQQNVQQHQQFPNVESETDAGFDETIVAEMDENTALEYIEEDGCSSNTPTTNTNTGTILGKKKKLQQKTSTNTIPTVIASLISNQEDTKPVISTSNNNLDSTYIDNLEMEPTITKSIADNVTEETIANNSATTQIEP